MSIEENLGRIATALEKIAAQGTFSEVAVADVAAVAKAKAEADAAAAAKAKAKADADAAAAAKAKADALTAAKTKADADAKVKAEADAAAAAAASVVKATKDDVRKALQNFREIEGTPAMLEVLKSFGADNLNELKESQYDEVVAKVS
jgi:membrane protein involved in colicin uptake